MQENYDTIDFVMSLRTRSYPLLKLKSETVFWSFLSSDNATRLSNMLLLFYNFWLYLDFWEFFELISFLDWIELTTEGLLCLYLS